MRVHFRYHDGVDALMGTDRYRYETHDIRDLEGLIKSLAPKGYDEFCYRPLNTLRTWQMLILDPHTGAISTWPADELHLTIK